MQNNLNPIYSQTPRYGNLTSSTVPRAPIGTPYASSYYPYPSNNSYDNSSYSRSLADAKKAVSDRVLKFVEDDIEKYPCSESDIKEKKAQYFFKSHGCECSLTRNSKNKAWYSTIKLPEDHPDFKKSYTDASMKLMDVHGGFTGSKDGVFTFNFAHPVTDVIPHDLITTKMLTTPVVTYKQYEFAIVKTRDIAYQFSKKQKGK